jgi:hypothetical protein
MALAHDLLIFPQLASFGAECATQISEPFLSQEFTQ